MGGNLGKELVGHRTGLEYGNYDGSDPNSNGNDEQAVSRWRLVVESQSKDSSSGTVLGNTIKKDVGWERPGRLLASFIVRSMQRSLCLSVYVFFLGGGRERQKMAGQQG